MAIKKIPGRGLEVELDDFVKLKAFQSGGEFWGHEHQAVIREHLEEFLPRMEVQSDGRTVLAQLFVKGKEVASASNPATGGVPKNERKKLEKALSRLKEKAADQNADQTTRSIIDAFRLPDPQKDSELYRVYGSRFNPKLLVVWGCEKEPGTSIVPDAAPEKIRHESAGSQFIRRSPWLLLVLLLAGLAFYGIQSGFLGDSPSESPPLAGIGPEESEQPRGSSTDPGADPESPTNTADDGGAAPSAKGTGVKEDGDGNTPGANLAEGTTPAPEATTIDNGGKGATSGEAKEGAMPADGTASEGNTGEENFQASELVVEEPDPDADSPLVTRERPADRNLVDLAKITRAAVVLVVLSDSNGNISSTGSGFLISPDGLIATNHHVLEGAAGAVVKLANGKALTVGEVVAADEERDLAIFKIDTGGYELPFLSLGEGPGAEVGENIAVIGSPLGLEGTFTVGIVSSTRKLGNVDFLQITAPISHGSSGSPVIDYGGEVVGVAVGAIEEGQSLNFAAAVSELRELLAQKGGGEDLLKTTGKEALNKRRADSLSEGAAKGEGVIVGFPPSKDESEAPPLAIGTPMPRPSQSPITSPNPSSMPAPITAENDSPSVTPGSAPPDAPSATKVAPEPNFRIAQIEKRELTDGKVEVTLEIQTSSGAPAKLASSIWMLNDQSPSGARIEGARFVHQIKEGNHNLKVTGKTTSGEDINIKATMNIEVEVRSAVEIRHIEDQ